MAIKKHKPSLEGVLKRRRTTLAEYFTSLGVVNHDQLVIVLEALIGAYRISESFQEEAFAWVATLARPQTISQKPEVVSESESVFPVLEKSKKPLKRSPKRSTVKGRPKTENSPESNNEEE